MIERQRLHCPFCRELIVETSWPTYDVGELEDACRAHLVERHPIRWRLSRTVRMALRARPVTS